MGMRNGREHRHPISRKVAQAFDQEGKEATRQQAHMCRRKPAQTDAESGARDERGAENTLFLSLLKCDAGPYVFISAWLQRGRGQREDLAVLHAAPLLTAFAPPCPEDA
jgi:hypothetical protein